MSRLERWLPRERTEIRFSLLLVLLVGLLVVLPAAANTPAGRVAVLLVWWGLLISAALAAGRRGRMRRIALALACVAVAVNAIELLRPESMVRVASSGLDAIVLGLVIALLFDHLATRRMVTTEVVVGGICVYFLLATFFSQLYGLIEGLRPGSFLDGGQPMHTTAAGTAIAFIYFSFVTMTTLGYGDVAPVAPIARSVAALEAFVGQVYLAIMIAYLVGVRVAQASGTRGEGD